MGLTDRIRVRRERRRKRIRRKISGTKDRPRLSVGRTIKHLYAQIIDDESNSTIAFASTRERLAETGTKSERARLVGKAIAERALEKGVKRVVFDRGGRLYHGRVKAIAEAARESGLEF